MPSQQTLICNNRRRFSYLLLRRNRSKGKEDDGYINNHLHRQTLRGESWQHDKIHICRRHKDSIKDVYRHILLPPRPPRQQQRHNKLKRSQSRSDTQLTIRRDVLRRWFSLSKPQIHLPGT